VDEDLLVAPALFAQGNLAAAALALPRHLGVVVLELVEEDVEACPWSSFLNSSCASLTLPSK